MKLWLGNILNFTILQTPYQYSFKLKKSEEVTLFENKKNGIACVLYGSRLLATKKGKGKQGWEMFFFPLRGSDGEQLLHSGKWTSYV